MTAEFRLDGRVVVVTGGRGLLGSRHVRALRAAGAQVISCDIGAVAVPDAGDSGVLELAVDVTDPAALEAACQQALDRFGRLDGLVTDAAIDDKVEGRSGEPVPFEELPLAAWERSIKVNVTGTFLACQVFGGAMARAGRGSVVTIGSTYGLVAPDQGLYVAPDGRRTMFKAATYPASKGAVLALTRYLAAYWGERGVRVNCLCPGGVANGQADWFADAYCRRTPLGRMAAPTDYDGAVVFLLSDASAYMTGTTLTVDGGWTAW